MLFLAAALAIQIDIHPTIADPLQLLTRPTPETYTCSALVIDEGEKKIIAGVPKLVVLRGKEEKAEKTAGEYSTELTVKIQPATNLDAQTAVTHVIVKHNGEVIADQHSAITLLPDPGKRFKYVR